MSIAERLADTSNRFYDAIRHPAARKAAEGATDAKGLEALEGHKYCLLTTFKRSGDPVATPVWFGVGDGKLFLRTYADAVKIKRLRANPRVLVGPCDVRGKPKGPMVEGEARVVSAEEEPGAER